MEKDSLKNIRQGYRQGKVGAHEDGGMEFAHGRAESMQGHPGAEMGKQAKARQDGGMEGAKGKMNQRSEMGHSRGFDATICRYMDAHTDGGMEHSKGRSTTASKKAKSAARY